MNVLFLIFNRPDLTERVFSRIRDARPERLFVAADGPRGDRPTDQCLCKEARTIVENVDWSCEVLTLFRDSNLGCKQAVSSAITWFFEHVDDGIILEDDCLPDPSFFPFCCELLERYRNDERVMVISGDNFQSPEFDPGASYYFSIYPHCWGWATWRRAWALYDVSVSLWPGLKCTGWLNLWLEKTCIADYWSSRFDAVYTNQLDTWDYQWVFSCWVNGGLSILPTNNVVENIGFDARATHTTGAVNLSAAASVLSFPLAHPPFVVRNRAADIFTARQHFNIHEHLPPTLRQRVCSWLRRFKAVRCTIWD